MAEAKNIRLYTPGGERISDPALAEDYLAGGQGRALPGRAAGALLPRRRPEALLHPL